MSLLKSALTVSGLTLVSRVTGVIRDMLIARFFGASAETDAFYVAFRLPNMLRRLFAEGAFQQAFVPMLADVKERSEGEAGTFIDHVFTVLALSRGGAKTKHLRKFRPEFFVALRETPLKPSGLHLQRLVLLAVTNHLNRFVVVGIRRLAAALHRTLKLAHGTVIRVRARRNVPSSVA